MPVHLLGIRHHGPGSCRNVLETLQTLKPDLILLEGPAEAEPLVHFVTHEQMKPPVALLAYQPDCPQHAVFYPFAEFSPEWQTLCYAVGNGIPLRFFDLPLTYAMPLEYPAPEITITEEEEETETEEEETQEAEEETAIQESFTGDPFDYLAEAAGYTDGESWWEMNIEQRKDNTEIFQAVKEAVTALREALPKKTSRLDLLREAWMRKMLRTAQKENFSNIAVVCGAWHVPALETLPKVKEDNELLKGLEKVKIDCTWIPWTYDRLSLRSGYGAGISSPGWYHYLWHHPEDDGTVWVSQAAQLFREKGMDISVAHVIETVRLARMTAALRNMPAPSLAEFNEAITTVMGFGDDILLQLIKESLIINNRLGQVPDGVPKVPLLTDVEKTQKRLRVPFTAEIKEVLLDLRKPNDLDKSIFFHRLCLLGIDWATPESISRKGTFKEKWTLYHKPEQLVSLIEKAIWGNTLEEATQKYLVHKAVGIENIAALTELLHQTIPADLPALVETLTTQLDRLSAASSDIAEMMEAVPHLVEIVRYGDVRQMDFSHVGEMLRAMVARILAGGIPVTTRLTGRPPSPRT